MIHIMFVCHGNICRSPMAEFIFRDMVGKRGLGDLFFIASSATSDEELGNSVYPGARKKLKEYGISTEGKQAVQLNKKDYEKYDYLIGMEQINITNMLRIVGSDPSKKISRLLDFTEKPGDIDDPWYTDNFDQAYDDIYRGCEGLLEHITDQLKLKHEDA